MDRGSCDLDSFPVSTEVWRELRGLRASPPGLAASDPERREVFSAALQQSEELGRAAADVGHAARPILAFYALSQGGRAIAAACAQGGLWRLMGHGASVKPGVTDVPALVITRHSKQPGAIGGVAACTGSRVWTGGATVAQLWATLPELPIHAAMLRGLPAALELLPGPYVDYSTGHAMGDWSADTAAGIEVPDEFYVEGKADVARFLEPYPEAEGWRIVANWIPNRRSGRQSFMLKWPSANDPSVNRDLHLVADWHDGAWWLRPAVGDSLIVPSRLVCWWGLLLALSSLARYEPAAWRRALDIDASPIAVSLEEGLDLALDRIPEMLLDALDAPT